MSSERSDNHKTWKRVDIIVSDAMTNKQITVKMWNRHVDNLTVSVGDQVVVKNLMTDVYQNTVSMNSVDETRIEVCTHKIAKLINTIIKFASVIIIMILPYFNNVYFATDGRYRGCGCDL